jgi:hypothetical protein
MPATRPQKHRCAHRLNSVHQGLGLHVVEHEQGIAAGFIEASFGQQRHESRRLMMQMFRIED